MRSGLLGERGERWTSQVLPAGVEGRETSRMASRWEFCLAVGDEGWRRASSASRSMPWVARKEAAMFVAVGMGEKQ